MMRNWFPRGAGLWTLVFFLTCVVGCGSRTVTGKVTLNGQPVDGGTITFIPTEVGGTGNVSGEIKGGTYTLTGPRAPKGGPHKVQISWKKKSGQKVPVPGDPGSFMDETSEVIPAEYNTQSQLKADVQSGVNTFDFELKAPS